MPSAVAPSRPPPIYFIGHAGVSLLFDESPKNHIVQDNLRAVGKEIRELSPRPKAIITFSGHFEAGEIHGPGVIEGEICLVLFRKVQAIADTFTLAVVNHDFVNDFHDTHPFVYEYEWPHEDAPELAVDVWRHLTKSGIRAKRVERGVDHGVWVPFKLMFPPEAPLDVPIIQVSTFHGYDLGSQIRLGEAFQPLRNEGYLIVASGMAVHSFPSIAEIRAAPSEDAKNAARAQVLEESRTFDTRLRAAVTKRGAVERRKALLELESLPEYRRSHPTVEVGQVVP
ncbi:putative aromatic ring-opening dioxygenase protein [Eutypa lata UCREL1]|uniref:Putative aromatic ring-opening dioxygenase protein n=1 Tax=Eutypa lata (strain UCR-EL1) TaxID=1287681 RepID=M7TLH3_EUTLA|nr:putative aromatic ring-opening dioxygenase protein [Eutypa lata UCREL1]